MIKTNSALRASLAIYHLISNTRLFIIIYESSFFWPRISYKVDTSPQTHFPVYCDHKANGLNPEIENIWSCSLIVQVRVALRGNVLGRGYWRYLIDFQSNKSQYHIIKTFVWNSLDQAYRKTDRETDRKADRPLFLVVGSDWLCCGTAESDPTTKE